MKIGMCDLVTLGLATTGVLTHYGFLHPHDVTSGIRTHTFIWKYMEICVLLGLSTNKEACWSTFVFLATSNTDMYKWDR